MNIVVNTAFPQETINHRGYYQNILSCLGYSDTHPPVADWLRRYHKLEGRWLVLSPIFWQATHNDAMIMACDHELDLSDSESQLWFNALSDFLKEDPIKLHYHNAYMWLIQFEQAPALNAIPVHQLLRRSITQALQTLDEKLFWSRFITENQMFFSQNRLNQSRGNRYPINGLWVWGDGVLNTPSNQLIIASEDLDYDLCAVLSTNVTRGFSEKDYPHDALLLLPNLEEYQIQKFDKNTVHWYWNNTTYVTRPSGLWARVSSCASRFVRKVHFFWRGL